ncbi:metallophosphoesterase [Alcanivorax balearicus MACL04]|uniref:DNA repair exonuclease n=2 Tax=Alloalcanivorax TaxID=3020832 RepID=A0A9Q3W5V2_9GAMM|nr:MULTISPECIES: DNA repair exonuclease [Alloalcanivorax]MCE7509574.1 DNA repair exonuclease [Alloalcanivorax xenomutans]MCU5784533.1 metallophosphoesterase [Alloalcanivorax balearicus MACL04]
MSRFLHTADWQVGRQYSNFAPDDAVALAEARLSVIERIADLASEEAVDAVLVAGDVFDAQTVSDRTIRRLFNAMSPYTGPWILIPGNHDAALAESVWTRAQRLGAVPDNAHLALRPKVLEFAEAGFAVLPAPLTQRHTQTDLTGWFDQAETPLGLLRIGLAHGSVQGILAEEVDSPNPIAANRADTARLDYLALGDWHGSKEISLRVWYSGTPEQDRFKGNDPGNVLLVDIPKAGAEPRVEIRPTGQHPWIQMTERLAVSSDLDQLIAKLEQQPEKAVVALRLEGEITLLGKQQLEGSLSVAEARFRSLRYDLSDLSLLATDEDIAALHADGYVGEVISELRDEQNGDAGEIAREAMAILASMLLEKQAVGGDA